jgi:cytochrome P450
MTRVAAAPQHVLRPPAPSPHEAPLHLIALLKALWRNPLEAWARPHFEEPIVTSKLGTRQVALVNEPQAVRRILLDNAANYGREPMQRRIMFSTLNNGLLMADDQQWMAQRRILGPLFTRKSVRNFAPAMLRAANDLVERWQALNGKLIDVAAEVTLVTLNVLERTIFSEGLGRNPVEVRDAMRKYFDSVGRIEPLDLLGLPDFIPRLAQFRIRSPLRLFNDTIDAIITSRRRHLAESTSKAPRDILSLLLEAADPETGYRLSETELRANIITFIAAGHETTANAIMWSLFLLSQSPEWEKQVVTEADRELRSPKHDADRLVVTRAVVEEAIRLYPPIAAITRCAYDRDELAGVNIRPGAMIVIAPYVLHRHRRLWQNPDIFDPTRFVGRARDEIDRFAYMPFGFGPRMCIGQAFALQEAPIIVASVMRHLVLELSDQERVWPVLRITVRPKNGLPMRLRSRHARVLPVTNSGSQVREFAAAS